MILRHLLELLEGTVTLWSRDKITWILATRVPLFNMLSPWPSFIVPVVLSKQFSVIWQININSRKVLDAFDRIFIGSPTLYSKNSHKFNNKATQLILCIWTLVAISFVTYNHVKWTNILITMSLASSSIHFLWRHPYVMMTSSWCHNLWLTSGNSKCGAIFFIKQFTLH